MLEALQQRTAITELRLQVEQDGADRLESELEAVRESQLDAVAGAALLQRRQAEQAREQETKAKDLEDSFAERFRAAKCDELVYVKSVPRGLKH